MTSRTAKTATCLLFASSAIVLSMVSPAKADPSWSDITQTGAGTFSVDSTSVANTTIITQTSTRAVGYANNLSIKASDTVNIKQTGRDALFVAKANANDAAPSQILGTLRSDGNVMVIDGNGVFFSKDATIDVGGIIASTGSIDDNEVMTQDQFTITNPAPAFSLISSDNRRVENHATINVKEAGLVAFVAPNVINDGVINAKLGRVALAAGERVTIDMTGDRLVEVALTNRQSRSIINNAGDIVAEGGTIQITAESGRNALTNAINLSGVIDASSVTQKGGKIILGGDKNTITMDKVRIDASGNGAGSIDVDAGKIVTGKNAKISANGGDGSIRLYANNAGNFNGYIDAVGGHVETSALRFFSVNKDLRVVAKEWLIDPIDILINSGMAAAISSSLNLGTNTTVLTSAPGPGAGNITLTNTANITWNTAAKLSLVADNNVLLNGKINSNFVGTGTQGAVNVTSNGSFTIAGTGSIQTNGGDVVIDNKGIYTATTDSVRTSGTGKIEINQANGGSLQNAINSIRNTGSGLNTLNVFAGNFAENININQDNFLLSGKNNVGIDPNTSARNLESIITAANPASPTIRSSNKNISVDGMKIVGGKDGINFTGDDGRVLNNIIEDQIGMGVNFKGVDNGVISRNLFKGKGGNAAQSTFANFISFKNNVVEKGGASGLIASSVAQVEVILNKVKDVVGEGIGVFNYTTANIDNNTVENAGRIGIRAQYGSDQLDITTNNITNSGYDGVLVNGAKNVNVSNNIINYSGNGIDDGGIVLRAVQSAIVNKNNIDKTGWYGIAADGVNKAVITNNTINATGGQGIFNRNSKFDGVEPSVLISGNIITNTGGTGISLTKFLNAHVINNIVDTTGTFGIWATGEFSSLSSDDSRVLIEDNKVSNNQQNAIRVNNVQDITIADNTADKTRYMGVRVHDFDTASISKNNVTNTGLSGVDVRNGKTSLLFKDNIVSSAARDGVYILNVKNADIIDNNVLDSRDDGIAIGGSDIANIINNRVRNSKVNGLYVFGPNNGVINVSENTFTDNDIGAQFESGLIDFTGIGNEFINGRVGLRFSPSSALGASPLRLVDNDGPGSSAPGVAFPTNFGGTIGEQLFDGQTQYFVELANGAFFEPGRYTWLNGLNSTYRMGDGTLFRPSTVGGILNADQLAFLESRFFHNVDDATLGRFFFGALPEINQEDIFNQFNPFAFGAGNVRVTILGLPRLPGGGGGVGAGGVNLAGLLNNLAPNAGGDDNSNVDVSSLTPEMLNQIEAAAGGDGADSEGSNNTGGGTSNTACWNDASVGAQQGQVTTISFGGELGASSIETANNCRNK